jgi:DNA adenine methylase
MAMNLEQTNYTHSEIPIHKPFLKWVGGKSQIIYNVIQRFPKEIKNYYEPFLGGGSVLLALLSYYKRGDIKINEKIYANDINPNLIALYKNVQKHPQELIEEIKKQYSVFEACHGSYVNRNPQTFEEAKTSRESYYYWIRSQFNKVINEERESIIASAMMLFLNKTCFRGLYREGPNGFNVPYGNYKKPTIMEAEYIKEISELIQDVVFSCSSYEDFLKNVSEKDYVYLDPPYAPEKDTSFVKYTTDGFNIDKHQHLFNLCKELTTKKVKMLMSNADVVFVREAFNEEHYNVITISCRRAIHSKEPASRTNELLIQNY